MLMDEVFDFKKFNNIHFIGIGGIGISAIARMMLLDGKKVTGSDRSVSKVTDELATAGAKIAIGQSAENIPAECDLVIRTVAVAEDNLEFLEARRRNLPIMTYPQALHEISKEKFTIAISGTHGKTTTTAMIAKILIDAKLDPTVIVGSLLRETGTNFIAGKSDLFIVEADEYKNAFFNIEPDILVINNIDADHLDFFKDLADIQNSFRQVAEKVPEDGYVIYDGGNNNVLPAVFGLKCHMIDYSKFKTIPLNLQSPGNHNRSNAAAAFAVGRMMNVNENAIVNSLENFSGTWRRFEYKGKTKSGALVYDDYGHNPQKVRAALQGAREMFKDKKITVIFQPHLYSRTKFLLKEFSESFVDADVLILLPIYAAREVYDPTITSDILAEEIRKCIGENNGVHFLKEVIVANDKNDAVTKVPSSADVIITLGAGDVTEISNTLVS